MLVSERERVRYNADYDYDYQSRNDRFMRSGYETGYEEERNRTSSAYRDSLMDSLERPATRSRLERSDENRYGFYMANIQTADNNYDRFWDSKRERGEQAKPASPKKRMSFIVAYFAIALVAVIAVTLSVVGIGNKETVVKKNLTVETLSANAEVVEAGEGLAGATAPAEEEETAIGGENYIMINGELTEIKVPKQMKAAEEEEKGFDKFCSWLNGVFGG